MADQKLIIVSGKGGVGKTVVSSAMALAAAKSGKRVLLAELGEGGQLQHIFGDSVSFRPKKVRENLYLAAWSGEACLREYLYHFIKIQKVVDLFFDNRIMKTFIKAAPALKELAIMGKLTSGPRKWGPPMPYDLVVLDAYATGHFLSLMKAPKGMAELIKIGPMGVQSKNIYKTLMDSEISKYTLVTLPEEMPSQETLELNSIMETEFRLHPQVVVNKWFDLGHNKEELLQLKEKLAERNNEDPSSIEFISYLENMLGRQEHSKELLNEKIKSLKYSPLVLDIDLKNIVETVSKNVGEDWIS